ncbi:MAG TPA: hypothetical protein ENI27_09800 [bacterium]|nr:hypothetical protein [bacterium]
MGKEMKIMSNGEYVEKKKRHNEMRRLRNEGQSLSEIAKQFGMTRQRVHQIIGPTKK